MAAPASPGAYNPQTSDYLDTLQFEFQAYFYKHVRRAITFFVQASVQEVYDYMNTVLTHGPRHQYAINRFLSTRDEKRQLRECVSYALEELVNTGEIEKYYTKKHFEYFMSELLSHHIGRQQVSWYIYDVLQEWGTEGADRFELMEYIKSMGEDYDQNVINELIRLGCIVVKKVNHRPRYIINFD